MLLFIFFLLWFAYGERRIKPNSLPDELPFVSVIICARNEENNIRRCLDSMMELDYPREKLEILVIDDESELRDILPEFNSAVCSPFFISQSNPRGFDEIF